VSAPHTSTLSATPQTPSFRLIAVLGTVAMLSGLLIVLVYQWTLPTITEQKRLALERAVQAVIPGASSIETLVLEGGQLHPDSANVNGLHVYLGYDQAGTLQGIAAEGSGQGYADLVKILYGYDPACQCISGFKVVASRETPGFGDKLDRDPKFLANFQALDVQLDAEQQALANEVVTVKHGTKSKPWQIDAISGATVSSRAVGRAINDSASKLLPVLTPRLSEFAKRSP